jgi:two-component system cell cycle response regulator DivK
MAGELILVVDDCSVNLKLTRLLLMSEGYEVLTAASGEEALAVLQSRHAELVLADIQMPGMDGLTLTRRLKQNPSTRGIPVIAVTALAMKGDAEKALDAGCDGYIVKPIDIREVRRNIRAFLDRRAGSNAGAPISTGAAQACEVSGMDDLRLQFWQQGRSQLGQWLTSLYDEFSPDAMSKTVHQWVGTGALLGFRDISTLAREVETTLRERPVDMSELRDELGSLCAEFDRRNPQSRQQLGEAA